MSGQPLFVQLPLPLGTTHYDRHRLCRRFPNTVGTQHSTSTTYFLYVLLSDARNYDRDL